MNAHLWRRERAARHLRIRRGRDVGQLHKRKHTQSSIQLQHTHMFLRLQLSRNVENKWRWGVACVHTDGIVAFHAATPPWYPALQHKQSLQNLFKISLGIEDLEEPFTVCLVCLQVSELHPAGAVTHREDGFLRCSQVLVKHETASAVHFLRQNRPGSAQSRQK